jgi:Mrp family chromosome partitioning ATPase
VLGLTLLAVGAAAAWLSVKEPRYEATAEILITPLPAASEALLGLQLVRESSDPTRVMQTAAELVDSNQAALLTAATVGDGSTRVEVQRAVEVEPRGQSNILAVTAEARDPQLAARVANVFVDSALRARRDALGRQIAVRIGALEAAGREGVAELRTIAEGGDPTMSVSQEAVAPEAPAGAPSWLVFMLAGIAGLGIGAGAAVLVEAVNRRVLDEHELVELYPLPVLARVPRLSRAKLRGSGPFSMPAAAREAYRTLQVQLDQRDDGPRTVLFTSATAGDGKTSSVVQLGLALASAGHRVILIDFDFRKPDLGNMLSLPPSPGLVGLLKSDRRLAEVLVSISGPEPLLVAAAGSERAEALLLSALTGRLPQILAEARELADYVLVDSAPLGEVSDALRLVPHADDVIVVARPGNTERSDFESVRDLLDRTGVTPIGLLLIATGLRRGRYRTYGAPPAQARRRLLVKR